MDLLDACGVSAGDDQFVMGEALCLAAVLTEDRESDQVPLPSGLEGFDQIRRIATRGEHHQRIPWTSESLDLPGEHPVIAVVIGDARQRSRIGTETQGRHGGAFLAVASHQLLGHVEGIGGTAAIARGENLATSSQDRLEFNSCRIDRGCQGLGALGSGNQGIESGEGRGHGNAEKREGDSREDAEERQGWI